MAPSLAHQVGYYGAKFAYNNRAAIKKGATYLYKQYQDARQKSKAKIIDKARSITPGSKRIRGHVFKSKKGGFVKRGKKVKRKSKLLDVAKKGIQSHYEITGNVAAVNTVFVGHCTHPMAHLKETLAYALLKLLSIRMDNPMQNPDAIAGAQTSDTITLSWKADEDPGTVTQTYSYSFASPTVTWATVAANLSAYMDTNFTSDTVLASLTYFPYTALNGAVFVVQNYVKVRLDNASFTFVTKSALKMQNRTIDVAGEDNIDDLANVPLNGKSYEGTGTGSQFTTPTGSSSPFRGDRSSGLIKVTATDQQFSEVPYDYNFPGAKRSSKVRFDPGLVKTSVLSDTTTMHYRKWFPIMFGYNVPVYPNRNKGKFRFFALERMIGGSANNIVVYYEVETRVGCIVSTKKQTITTTQWLTYAG